MGQESMNMSEIKEKGLFINPYVIQMDRFADSLRHLSETFLSLEEYHQTFTREELEDMFIKVSERVCLNGMVPERKPGPHQADGI